MVSLVGANLFPEPPAPIAPIDTGTKGGRKVVVPVAAISCPVNSDITPIELTLEFFP